MSGHCMARMSGTPPLPREGPLSSGLHVPRGLCPEPMLGSSPLSHSLHIQWVGQGRC